MQPNLLQAAVITLTRFLRPPSPPPAPFFNSPLATRQPTGLNANAAVPYVYPPLWYTQPGSFNRTGALWLVSGGRE